MGRDKAKKPKRTAGARAGQALVVAVDGADLALLPAAAGPFSEYWAEVYARIRTAAATGRPVFLRPLVNFDYMNFCNQQRLNPRSQAALAAYEAVPVPEYELFQYRGDSPEVLLHLLRYERDAWATGIRSRAVLAAVVAQFGLGAGQETRAEARRLLEAVVGGARAGDELALVAKAAGLPLGAYATTIHTVDGRTAIEERDRSRLETLLAAALPAGATGAATLTSPGSAAQRVLVWELSPAGLVPSEHGELILAPNAPHPDHPKTEYLPGFTLTV
ncbi:hypothetical protein ACPC54_18420 [Kitasatospora sp. NPDC094028]